MSALGETDLHFADILVIILYFLFVLGVGLWSSIRSKRDSVSGYFLASRNMHWIPVGASLFASNIGSGHFIGLAGSGAASGIGISGFELNAIYILMLLGWVFAPVYMAAEVYTMPEYLRKRFGGQRIRLYLSVLALILYIFTKVSVDLYAGALFINLALDWDLYPSIMVLLIIAGVFTIAGGLSAVIWTDFVQTVLMIIGAFVLMVLSFIEVGGYNALVDGYFNAHPQNLTYGADGSPCGMSPPYSMSLLRDARPGASDLPWTGMTFGLTISAVWYWCSDQVIVQRVLASKNMSHAKGGTILAGYLKFLPLFLLVFPGMAAKVLYPNTVGCVVPDECEKICGSRGGCTNVAYPLLVIKLMPPGASGMMLAVMLAALMSSLTSIFNSSSTLFTIDIWTRMRKDASEYEKLFVGRIFVLVMVVISVLWIPIIQASQGSQLFNYIQSITSFLAPPICAIYVLAFFVPRCNEMGAFAGLMVGLVVGLLRFIIEFSNPKPPCGSDMEGERSYFMHMFIDNIHYLHFGCILFLITALVAMAVSLLTKPIDPKHLHRLTFWTRNSTQVREDLDEIELAAERERDQPEGNDTPATGMEINGKQEPPAESFKPTWRRALDCICGFDTEQTVNANPEHTEPKLTPEEKAKKAAEFLQEDPKEAMFVNINALICMTVAAFFWTFYA